MLPQRQSPARESWRMPCSIASRSSAFTRCWVARAAQLRLTTAQFHEGPLSTGLNTFWRNEPNAAFEVCRAQNASASRGIYTSMLNDWALRLVYRDLATSLAALRSVA